MVFRDVDAGRGENAHEHTAVASQPINPHTTFGGPSRAGGVQREASHQKTADRHTELQQAVRQGGVPPYVFCTWGTGSSEISLGDYECPASSSFDDLADTRVWAIAGVRAAVNRVATGDGGDGRRWCERFQPQCVLSTTLDGRFGRPASLSSPERRRALTDRLMRKMTSGQ